MRKSKASGSTRRKVDDIVRARGRYSPRKLWARLQWQPVPAAKY